MWTSRQTFPHQFLDGGSGSGIGTVRFRKVHSELVEALDHIEKKIDPNQ